MIFVSLFVLVGLPVRTAAEEVTPEFRLKAAVISHFPQFVDWPAATHPRDADFQICVLVPTPFGRVLDDLVDGSSIDGRPVTVRAVEAGNRLGSCRVLYLPSQAPGRDVALKRVSREAVLTIGDDDHFLDAGGIIQLRVVSNKVGFDVNLAAARAASLHLSAQLLRLASHVRGGGQ